MFLSFEVCEHTSGEDWDKGWRRSAWVETHPDAEHFVQTILETAPEIDAVKINNIYSRENKFILHPPSDKNDR